MNSLNDIMLNKNLDEPPEIAAIKQYVKRMFNSNVSVKVQPTTIIITANSAALAGTLRLSTRNLQKAAETDKRLIFRIGGTDQR